MKTILITGGRAPVALDWARRLHQVGHRVLTAEDPNLNLTTLSRAVNRSYRLPSPRFRPLEFRATVQNIVDREQVDLIIPTCEEIFWLGHLSMGHWPLWSCPQALLLSLHSKWTFSQLAENMGLSVPKTWLIQRRADLIGPACDFRNLVFKPEFSRFGSRTKICPKTRPELDFSTSWVAQEFCEGPEFCSFSLCHQGRIGAHVCYQPRARFLGGASTLFTSVNKPAIHRWVERFVSETKFTGQIGFDFIEGAQGQVKALECNPRSTSGLHLFMDCQRVTQVLSGSFHDCYEPKPDRSTWSELAHWNDPLPIFSGLKTLLNFWRRSQAWNCSLTEAMTADICWDGVLP